MNQLEEIDWLAYRYVAGEMSPDEAQSLETRMQTDEKLREAICRTVEITVGVSEGQPVAVSNPNPSLIQQIGPPIGWALFGALAATLVFILMSIPKQETSKLKPKSVETVQEILDPVIWAQIRREIPIGATDDWLPQEETTMIPLPP